MNGIIDEVGFWNRELTSSEVTDLYNSGAGLAYPLVPVSGPANVKSWNGVAIANVKSINGLAVGSIKSINGLA